MALVMTAEQTECQEAVQKFPEINLRALERLQRCSTVGQTRTHRSHSPGGTDKAFLPVLGGPTQGKEGSLRRAGPCTEMLLLEQTECEGRV